MSKRAMGCGPFVTSPSEKPLPLVNSRSAAPAPRIPATDTLPSSAVARKSAPSLFDGFVDLRSNLKVAVLGALSRCCRSEKPIQLYGGSRMLSQRMTVSDPVPEVIP